MKLKIEIDISDIIEYLNTEEQNLNSEIKRKVTEEATRQLYNLIAGSVSRLQQETQKEYTEKIKNHVEKLVDHTEWFTDNITASAITKHLLPQIYAGLTKAVIKDLKTDTEFIKAIAKECFNK